MAALRRPFCFASFWVRVSHGGQDIGAQSRPDRPGHGRAGLARARRHRHAAALLLRSHRPRRRLGAARVQPRAGDPAALSFYMFLHEMKAVPPPCRAGHRPLAGRRADRAGARDGAGRQPRPIDDLVFYALIVWVGGLVLVGFGGRRGRIFWPSVLHLVFMLPLPQFLYWQAQHRAAVRLLRDRRGASCARMGVPVVPRRQRHRPRGLQAAGGRGLLGAALPLPDHELLLRLRRALPRPGLAQARAAALGGADRGADELGPHRDHRRPRRPLRHRPGRGLPARLRGLGDLPLLHRHPVRDGGGDAADLGRPQAARRGDRPRLLRPRRPAPPGAGDRAVGR